MRSIFESSSSCLNMTFYSVSMRGDACIATGLATGAFLCLNIMFCSVSIRGEAYITTGLADGANIGTILSPADISWVFLLPKVIIEFIVSG